MRHSVLQHLKPSVNARASRRPNSVMRLRHELRLRHNWRHRWDGVDAVDCFSVCVQGRGVPLVVLLATYWTGACRLFLTPAASIYCLHNLLSCSSFTWLQEKERRARNQPSAVNFRHTRLHELGPAHLMVRNIEAGPGAGVPDPVRTAQVRQTCYPLHLPQQGMPGPFNHAAQ